MLFFTRMPHLRQVGRLSGVGRVNSANKYPCEIKFISFPRAGQYWQRMRPCLAPEDVKIIAHRYLHLGSRAFRAFGEAGLDDPREGGKPGQSHLNHKVKFIR